MRRPPLRFSFARIDAGQHLHGIRRFAGKAATGLGQLIDEPFEIALEPLGSPLGAGNAALGIFDDRLDPFPQAGSDLGDPRTNSDVEGLAQFARLRLDRGISMLYAEQLAGRRDPFFNTLLALRAGDHELFEERLRVAPHIGGCELLHDLHQWFDVEAHRAHQRRGTLIEIPKRVGRRRTGTTGAVVEERVFLLLLGGLWTTEPLDNRAANAADGVVEQLVVREAELIEPEAAEL